MNLTKRLSINCILPLFLSLSIYVLFRPRDIIINKLLSQLLGNIGFSYKPDSFLWMIYSLPGALWMYAFLSFNAIFNRRFIYSFIPLALALSIELLQYLHITDGTFDMIDVMCYFITWLFFIIVKNTFYKSKNLEQFRPEFLIRKRYIFGFFISIVLLSDVWSR